ncbi:hypothetical protein H4R34_001888 [Dimargaris verticillata]|uniref:MHD domain-containing protein n=1 Tax=Dimargaris verticillata TaxID=2761393 RepID=A0A9W8EEK1_9FUNG|nr:hypothetical protein H4R34_001888 [Dimargaris verticillata]
MAALLLITVQGDVLIDQLSSSGTTYPAQLLAKLHQLHTPTLIPSGSVALHPYQFVYVLVDSTYYFVAAIPLVGERSNEAAASGTRAGSLPTSQTHSPQNPSLVHCSPLLNPVTLQSRQRSLSGTGATSRFCYVAGLPSERHSAANDIPLADLRPQPLVAPTVNSLSESTTFSLSVVTAMTTLMRLIRLIKSRMTPMTQHGLQARTGEIVAWYESTLAEFSGIAARSDYATSSSPPSPSHALPVIQSQRVGVDLVEQVVLRLDPIGEVKHAAVEGVLSVDCQLTQPLPIEIGLEPYCVAQQNYPDVEELGPMVVPLVSSAVHPLAVKRDSGQQTVLVYTPTHGRQRTEVLKYTMNCRPPVLFRIFGFVDDMMDVSPDDQLPTSSTQTRRSHRGHAMSASATALPASASHAAPFMGASLFQGTLPTPRSQLFQIEFSIRLRSDFAQQFTAEQVALTVRLPFDTTRVKFGPEQPRTPSTEELPYTTDFARDPPRAIYRFTRFPGGHDQGLLFWAYSESATIHPAEFGPISITFHIPKYTATGLRLSRFKIIDPFSSQSSVHRLTRVMTYSESYKQDLNYSAEDW